MNQEGIRLNYTILGDDLAHAGEASSSVKKKLNQLGIAPPLVKKATISMYEAEMNSVIHANGGNAYIEINTDKITIIIKDNGPGIQDIELAMQEGYSTAPDSVRQMGFGAGMGLPNMKRYADSLNIESQVGRGTTVTIVVNIN